MKIRLESDGKTYGRAGETVVYLGARLPLMVDRRQP